jgi:hypothetical protein
MVLIPIPIVGERIVGADGCATAAGLFAEGMGSGLVGTLGRLLGMDTGDGAPPGDLAGAFGALLATGGKAPPGDFTGAFGALLDGLDGDLSGDLAGAAAAGLAGDPTSAGELTWGAIGDAEEFTGRSTGGEGNTPVLVGSVVSSPACTVGVFVGLLVGMATITGVSTGAATGSDATTGVEIGVMAGAFMGACAGAAVGAQGNCGSVDNWQMPLLIQSLTPQQQNANVRRACEIQPYSILNAYLKSRSPGKDTGNVWASASVPKTSSKAKAKANG